MYLWGDSPHHDTPIPAIAFSLDGKTLASAGYDQLVRTFTL